MSFTPIAECRCKYMKKLRIKEKRGKIMVMELFSKDTKRIRGKDTGSQGKRQHLAGKETASQQIRAAARIN